MFENVPDKAREVHEDGTNDINICGKYELDQMFKFNRDYGSLFITDVVMGGSVWQVC